MKSPSRILALFGARVIFGAERENIEVLAALRDQGCEVLCLVRHEAWNDAIPEALAARGFAYRKVPYIDGWLKGWRLRTVFRNPIAFAVGNWQYLKILREFRPTHIHAFNPFYILNFFLGLVLVWTPLVYRAGEKPVIHSWIWRVLWRFVVARTCCFVAVSNFIAGELKETGIRPERIEVIYGHPPKRIGNNLPPTVPRPDETIHDIAYVGQITENKGPHLLIDAFHRIAESYTSARLLIAGRISDSGGDEWARALRDRIVNDPILNGRVHCLGFVENVPELLHGREVLAVPSIVEEGLPLVVLEAKTAGIPSIVFPSGGLPEMIKDGVDGIICRDKSVEALIEALRVYFADPSLTKRHGMAARASLQQLGIDEFSDRWLAIYTRSM